MTAALYAAAALGFACVLGICVVMLAACMLSSKISRWEETHGQR